MQSQLTDAADGRLIHTAEAVTGPRAAQARRLSAQLRDFQSSCPAADRSYWRAAIAAQLGGKEEALRLFEDAVAQEFFGIGQADHDMLLEPLWDEPRFRALVRPYETHQP